MLIPLSLLRQNLPPVRCICTWLLRVFVIYHRRHQRTHEYSLHSLLSIKITLENVRPAFRRVCTSHQSTTAYVVITGSTQTTVINKSSYYILLTEIHLTSFERWTEF